MDLAGIRFGRWTALARAPREKKVSRAARWLCVCDCGIMRSVNAQSLREDLSQSCGCLSKEILRSRVFKHGASGRANEYFIWNAMKQRCLNPNDRGYKNYGARGISVCARWENSFELFLQDVGKKPLNMSLERIDNDIGYSPSNCKWATKVEQSNNTRTVKRYAFRGEFYTARQIFEIVRPQIKFKLFSKRLWSGWDIERASAIQ